MRVLWMINAPPGSASKVLGLPMIPIDEQKKVLYVGISYYYIAGGKAHHGRMFLQVIKNEKHLPCSDIRGGLYDEISQSADCKCSKYV